jgi:CspA family cold shock protein
MATGKIKWFNEDKGFGFIKMENGNEVFVHFSGLYKPFINLHAEDKVTFEVKNSDKGPYAVEVKPIH